VDCQLLQVELVVLVLARDYFIGIGVRGVNPEAFSGYLQ
jgi:hypothetical protein